MARSVKSVPGFWRPGEVPWPTLVVVALLGLGASNDPGMLFASKPPSPKMASRLGPQAAVKECIATAHSGLHDASLDFKTAVRGIVPGYSGHVPRARDMYGCPSSGGITPERVDACINAGAAGAAGITRIMKSKNPKHAIGKFMSALKSQT